LQFCDDVKGGGRRKADDYYCVEFDQIAGVPWCHFVLGMTEALVDRIHISYFVSVRVNLLLIGLVSKSKPSTATHINLVTTTDQKTACSAVSHIQWA